jgi:hypothetical protein
MAEIIIGATTPSATTIWVRGNRKDHSARITLRSRDGSDPELSTKELDLERREDFVGVERFENLRADTLYSVSLEFKRWRWSQWETKRTGSVRTFPESSQRFTFLHGSCNLSIVSLSNLGALAAGGAGTLAAVASLGKPADTWLWPKNCLRDVVAWAASCTLGAVVKLVFLAVSKLTGYQQPAPLLPSPFDSLLPMVDPEGKEPAAFAIHAGDQIYYDFPFPNRKPEREAYRRAYRQAWFEDPSLRDFLAVCPHYMILDDHDIVDGFPIGLDDESRNAYQTAAITAYREYVDSRHPNPSDESLYYQFEYGGAHFFVLDVRTERDLAKEEMIGPEQMSALEGWLLDHGTALKFVVSGVPFVAELRPDPKSDANALPAGTPPAESRDDKWCGRNFRSQREKLIHYLHRKEIERVIFLVGDLHCSYHASMRVGPPESRITIHELAGGPISQLQFTPRREFYDHYRGKAGDVLPFAISLESYHGSAAGVLCVSVEPGTPPRVSWEIRRTRTRSDKAEDKVEKKVQEKALEPVRPLGGEIQLL